MQTYIRTCIYPWAFVHAYTCEHKHIQNTDICKDMCAHSHMQRHTHLYTCTYTWSQMFSYRGTQGHIYTYVQIYLNMHVRLTKRKAHSNTCINKGTNVLTWCIYRPRNMNIHTRMYTHVATWVQYLDVHTHIYMYTQRCTYKYRHTDLWKHMC